MAQRGFDVFAADIAPIAVSFQTSDDSRLQNLIDQEIDLAIDESGSLHAEIHDFCQPFKHEFFDLIINVKAFQGFDVKTMAKVATTHFNSLKPSRQAIFDAINVQGEIRELFESTLVEAGFLIPFYELNCWYRDELNKTKLPYVFVLGNPIIPWHGVYADDNEKRKKDMDVLQEITHIYREKQQLQGEDEAEKLKHPDAKIASILYSTG